MRLASSLLRKAIVTAVAVGGFVSLYEVTVHDSRDSGGRGRETASSQASRPEPGARLPFTATAYCKGLVTSSGVPPQAGVAAADPALLPVGSIVEIDAANTRYDGIYSILDTGPAVHGPMLDIYIWSCNEALSFGRQPVDVRVLRLGWNPTATAPGPLERLLRIVTAAPSVQSPHLPASLQ